MRYEEVSKDVYELLKEVVKEHFEDLTNVNFKCVFDTKKKIKGGRFIFAYIKKVNEFTSFLAGDEFDYVIVIDKNIWTAINKDDKVRIIRHELRHCFIDSEKDDPYKIIDHEIEDFYAEIALNVNDPKWGLRVAAIAESIYDKDSQEVEE